MQKAGRNLKGLSIRRSSHALAENFFGDEKSKQKEEPFGAGFRLSSFSTNSKHAN